MPRHFPPEFKRDAVAVARSTVLTQVQVARDFGGSENSAASCAKQANIDDERVDVATSREQAELIALRRRSRVLEQEIETLRRATAHFAKDAAPK
jgi:transposase